MPNKTLNKMLNFVTISAKVNALEFEPANFEVQVQHSEHYATESLLKANPVHKVQRNLA